MSSSSDHEFEDDPTIPLTTEEEEAEVLHARDDRPQPFCLENIPLAFDNPGAVEAELQAELVEHQHGQGSHSDKPGVAAFHKLGPPAEVNLSVFQSIYQNGSDLRAMQGLFKRRRIVLDPLTVFDSDAGELLWSTDDHFLDYRLLLSKNLGLDAVVPNMRINHTWVATLNFNQWIVQWRAKHADLGFSLIRRMLLIGRAAQEDIWIVFAPREYVNHTVTEGDLGLDGTTTNLTPANSRRFYAFLCWQLTHLNISDFNSKKEYPDVTSASTMNAGCNILTHRPFDLTLENAKKLSTRIKGDYDRYFAEAPASWKCDPFFQHHVPLTATMRYGQNQRIVENPVSIDQEAHLWDEERDWSQVATAFIAVASDICVHEILEDSMIPNDIIERDNDVIYDSPTEPRNRLRDLGDLPLIDDDGETIKLYNGLGVEIQRVEYTCRTTACGLLVNFENIDSLFPQETVFEMDGELPMSTTVNKYPQAYLRDHGHIQANNVLATFLPIIEEINEVIQHPPGFEHPGDEVFRETPPVTGISCQMYNELAHRYRSDPLAHDVQLGHQTSALAGTHAETPKDKAEAVRRLAKCTPDLPYVNFQQKITSPNQNVNLRVEQVFKIDCAAMDPDYRTGWSIFQNVVLPITQAWNDGEVGDTMKPHITVFRPRIMPKLYLWTSYGVTSYLKRLWASARRDIATEPTSAYIIELTSCFERALNFSQTGSNRVISIALMHALGLALGIQHDGVPCVIMGVVQPNPTPSPYVTITQKKWPLYPKKPNGPMIGSKRSQEYNYSEIHWETYKARLDLLHLALHLPKDLYTTTLPAKNRQALVGLYYGMQLLIRDVKNLVVHDVEAVTKGCLVGENYIRANNEREQLDALKIWKMRTDPLSSDPSTVAALIRSVVRDPQEYAAGLQRSEPGTITSKAMATHLIECCYPSIKSPLPAPFSKLGSAHTVLRLALAMAANLLGGSVGDRLQAVMVAMVEFLLEDLHISHVPWHQPSARVRGRRSVIAVHTIWMAIGLDPTDRPDYQETLIEASNADAVNALAGARLISSQDTRGRYGICNLRWSDAKSLLTRRTLPEEYSRADAKSTQTGLGPSGESYVHRTYDHVSRVFKGCDDPLHHLALFSCLALIKSLPRVLRSARSAPTNIRTDLTTAVRNTPWYAREGKRGVSMDAPFVTMWIAFVVARFDLTSPLNAQRNRENGSMGDLWLAKHSAKGISIFNLVRMGFAEAKSKQIFTSPQDGSYSLKKPAEILAFHARVKQLLESPNPFAPFDALTLFVGVSHASWMASEGECLARPVSTITREPIASGSGTNQTVTRRHHHLDDDSDMEVEEVERPSKRKRT